MVLVSALLVPGVGRGGCWQLGYNGLRACVGVAFVQLLLASFEPGQCKSLGPMQIRLCERHRVGWTSVRECPLLALQFVLLSAVGVAVSAA